MHRIRPVSMHLQTPEDSDAGTEKFLSKNNACTGN